MLQIVDNFFMSWIDKRRKLLSFLQHTVAPTPFRFLIFDSPNKVCLLVLIKNFNVQYILEKAKTSDH